MNVLVELVTMVMFPSPCSFCRLNVTFAVDVTGKFVRKDWLALYIALAIFLELLLFVSLQLISTFATMSMVNRWDLLLQHKLFIVLCFVRLFNVIC